MSRRLLQDGDLERSDVVANCRMNRERELSGSNSYERELAFAPLDFLRKRIRTGAVVRWLDLCCGSGRALFQAADQLEQAALADAVALTGVDLVALFWSGQPSRCLRLVETSVHAYDPAERFDLITCVHGLHYLGDKLAVIERALLWLADDGLLAAHLDLGNLRTEDGRPLARRVGKRFREAGIAYDHYRRVLTCRGGRRVHFGLEYLGADDTAGPNCTGQAAVHSCYQAAP
jgi:SAM-dependent methyltransferase